MKTGNVGFKDAENKKGVKAALTTRERQKIDKEAAKQAYKPDLTHCQIIKEYIPGSPRNARPKTIIFKR